MPVVRSDIEQRLPMPTNTANASKIMPTDQNDYRGGRDAGDPSTSRVATSLPGKQQTWKDDEFAPNSRTLQGVLTPGIEELNRNSSVNDTSLAPFGMSKRREQADSRWESIREKELNLPSQRVTDNREQERMDQMDQPGMFQRIGRRLNDHITFAKETLSGRASERDVQLPSHMQHPEEYNTAGGGMPAPTGVMPTVRPEVEEEVGARLPPSAARKLNPKPERDSMGWDDMGPNAPVVPALQPENLTARLFVREGDGHVVDRVQGADTAPQGPPPQHTMLGGAWLSGKEKVKDAAEAVKEKLSVGGHSDEQKVDDLGFSDEKQRQAELAAEEWEKSSSVNTRKAMEQSDQKFGEMWQNDKETMGEKWADSKEKMGEKWEESKEKMGEKWEQAKETVGEKWEGAKEAVKSSLQAVAGSSPAADSREMGRQSDISQDRHLLEAEKKWGDAKDHAKEAWQDTKEASREGKEAAKDAWAQSKRDDEQQISRDETKSLLGEKWEHAKEMIGEKLQHAKEAVQGIIASDKGIDESFRGSEATDDNRSMLQRASDKWEEKKEAIVGGMRQEESEWKDRNESLSPMEAAEARRELKLSSGDNTQGFGTDSALGSSTSQSRVTDPLADPEAAMDMTAEDMRPSDYLQVKEVFQKTSGGSDDMEQRNEAPTPSSIPSPATYQ